MGHGNYSVVSSTTRTADLGYATLSNAEIFTQRTIKGAMNPYGVELRESRDSDEHPNSFPIVLGLDVTGSMGSIPQFLIREGFNTIMDKIIQGGEKDPQVMFVGIGDHVYDSSPLQVGQFESSDELLHKWFTDIFLEGGGGGNEGESYALAWYFAGFKTATDSFEKRGRKGVLFTIGDEPVLKHTPKDKLTNLLGSGQYSNYSATELLEKARETYNVYHIHVNTATGLRKGTVQGWKELMGDNLIVVDKADEVATAISDTVLKNKTGVATPTNNEEML